MKNVHMENLTSEDYGYLGKILLEMEEIPNEEEKFFIFGDEKNMKFYVSKKLDTVVSVKKLEFKYFRDNDMKDNSVMTTLLFPEKPKGKYGKNNVDPEKVRELVKQGYSNSEIAKKLCTYSTKIYRICKANDIRLGGERMRNRDLIAEAEAFRTKDEFLGVGGPGAK